MRPSFFFCVVLLSTVLIASCASKSNDDVTILPAPVTPADSLCGTMPTGDPAYTVRIVALVPNPLDSDDYSETFTVKNFNKLQPVDLTDWRIKDDEGVTWKLSALATPAILSSCNEIILTSDKQAELQNKGDTVYLVAPDGHIVQTIIYGNYENKSGEAFIPQ